MKNFRPISLLDLQSREKNFRPTLRVTRVLDEKQPIDQARFHRGFLPLIGLLFIGLATVNQKRNMSEYRKLLCLALADYEKAFDSVETKVILAVLELQGIEK